MNDMFIEYDANGKIMSVRLPDGSLFAVTEQQDQFIGGKLVSTHLSNRQISDGGATSE